MHAKIHWKTKQEGGRSKPPSGIADLPYITLMSFDGSENQLPWSLVVERLPAGSTDYEWNADIRFLMDGAPHHELCVNREFELFEGRKCVASGVILDKALADSPTAAR